LSDKNKLDKTETISHKTMHKLHNLHHEAHSNLRWTHVPKKGKQFQLYQWNPSCKEKWSCL